MSEAPTFEISLPDAPAPQMAALLEDMMQSLRSELSHEAMPKIEILKTDQATQDLGTILAIVLGANATIALAAGISAWMQRKNQGRIRIKGRFGNEVEINNLESRHVSEVLANLNQD